MTVGQIVDGWLLAECLRERGHSGAVYRVIRDGCPSLTGVLKVHTAACKVSRRMFRHENGKNGLTGFLKWEQKGK